MPSVALAATIRSRFGRTAIVYAALATLVACGSDTAPPPDIIPATITASSTDTLHAVVGTSAGALLTVIVKNKAGVVLDTSLVTFTVTTGGGTVSNPSSRTDVNGQASTTWTLGSATGVQTVTATAGTVSTTFTAIASAGSAATVTKLAGDAQTAPVGTNVTTAPSVKVVDKFGNPVANVLVTFSVASGSGSVTGSLVNTDANGVATVGSWKLGPVIGPNTLAATPTGLSAVTFSANGTAGAASQIVITTAPPTLNIGQSVTVAAQAKDANGNVLTGAAITFTSANAGVATVGATTGIVTAVGAGTTTITAALGTITAQLAVSVIGHPGATVVGTAAMGSAIGGIAIASNTAYIARSTANAIGVVDLPSATLTSSIDLAARPVDIAVNSGGTVIAAATSGPNLVWFVNAALARTDSIELQAAPVRMAMTTNGSTLFVAQNNFNMQVIDIPSRTITASIPIGGTVTAMKLSGDSLLYVGTKLGTIYEVSVGTNTVKRQFNPSSTVADIAIAPDGKTMFVADASASLQIVQLATGGMATAAVPFGGNVTAVGITPDGGQLWVGYPGTITIIPIINGSFDIATNTTVAGLNPSQIAFNRIGSLVAVADISILQIIVFK